MPEDPDPKLVDLPPAEWQSEDGRPLPEEPILGKGAPDFLWYIIGVTIAVAAIHLLR